MRGERAAAQRATACRVLIPFGTPYLYGLERGVIEVFDSLRPDVDPCFVQSRWVDDRRLPVVEELRRRALSYCLLPDRRGWPRLGRPRSVRHAARMLTAFVKANLYTARALRGRDVLYVSGVYAALFNVLPALWCRLTGRHVVHHFHDLGNDSRLLRRWSWFVTDFVHNTEFGRRALEREHPAIARKRNVVLPYVIDGEGWDGLAAPEVPSGRLDLFYAGQVRTGGTGRTLETCSVRRTCMCTPVRPAGSPSRSAEAWWRRWRLVFPPYALRAARCRKSLSTARRA
jgi:hypothetical protein